MRNAQRVIGTDRRGPLYAWSTPRPVRVRGSDAWATWIALGAHGLPPARWPAAFRSSAMAEAGFAEGFPRACPSAGGVSAQRADEASLRAALVEEEAKTAAAVTVLQDDLVARRRRSCPIDDRAVSCLMR